MPSGPGAYFAGIPGATGTNGSNGSPGFAPTQFANGQGTTDRSVVNFQFTATAGTVYGTGYLQASNYTATYMTLRNNGNATGVTHAWMGLMLLGPNGNGILIAQTADTPTLGTVQGNHKVPLVTPVSIAAGQSVAAVMLFTGGSPLICSTNSPSIANTNITPWYSQTLATGQNALPMSYTYSAADAFGLAFYFEITNS
jgi:hypothetical protein